MIQLENTQPIPISPQQYQAKFGVPAPVTNSPTLQTESQPQQPIPITAEQYQAKFGVPAIPPSAYDVSMGIKNPDGTTNTNQGIIPQAIDTFKQGFQQTKEGVANPDIVQGLQQIGRGALNEAGAGIRAAFSPIEAGLKVVSQLPGFHQAIGAITDHVINPASNAISDIPSVQKFMQSNPHADEVVGNLINIIGAIAGGDKAPEAVTQLKDTVTNTVDNVKEKISSINPPKDTTINPDQAQAQLKGVADDWAKPTTVNEPKYNNARAVLEKDPNVTTTLAQNGLNPFSNIEDGKYATEDTAQKLRNDTGQLSKNLLRPSLQEADYTVAPIAVPDLKPTIDDTYGVTADDAEAIQAKLQSKLDALQRKYPDGMNLTNQLDEKITYDKNGGYKAYKSNADNIDAIANRAIADSLRASLIANAPKDLPIEDFLAEQSKNYRAADYLDALHGKKAPVSPLQSAVRYGAKIIVAKTAGMIGGGDLVSEFVGYHIGGTLEKFVENMTNPMRDSFLKNLKITNPEAFIKMQAYLEKNK